MTTPSWQEYFVIDTAALVISNSRQEHLFAFNGDREKTLFIPVLVANYRIELEEYGNSAEIEGYN